MAKHADAAELSESIPDDGPGPGETESSPAATSSESQRFPALRSAFVMVAIVATMAGLVVFLGLRAEGQHRIRQDGDVFLATGRQAALNLTTINFTEVDADVQRILDSATGPFLDDFQKRSAPFVQVVKQAQSKSAGTVTAAGLASQDGDQAQVLVAVTVTTATLAAAETAPSSWRMRISVEKTADGPKVSDVQFVP